MTWRCMSIWKRQPEGLLATRKTGWRRIVWLTWSGKVDLSPWITRYRMSTRMDFPCILSMRISTGWMPTSILRTWWSFTGPRWIVWRMTRRYRMGYGNTGRSGWKVLWWGWFVPGSLIWKRLTGRRIISGGINGRSISRPRSSRISISRCWRIWMWIGWICCTLVISRIVLILLATGFRRWIGWKRYWGVKKDFWSIISNCRVFMINWRIWSPWQKSNYGI